jgi:hypothetical protein
MSKRMLSDDIIFDEEHDILTAYGTHITGALLRALSVETPEDVWFRVVKTSDGVSSVEMSVLERPRTAANAH